MATKLLTPYPVLAQWLILLWQAVTIKLRPRLLELLLGNILSGSGHITDAILSVLAKTSWTNYFKALQSNGFSWLSLCRQWLSLVWRFFPRLNITLVIDDVLTPRTSKKSSFGSGISRSCPQTQPAAVHLRAITGGFGHSVNVWQQDRSLPLVVALNKINRQPIKTTNSPSYDDRSSSLVARIHQPQTSYRRLVYEKTFGVPSDPPKD